MHAGVYPCLSAYLLPAAPDLQDGYLVCAAWVHGCMGARYSCSMIQHAACEEQCGQCGKRQSSPQPAKQGRVSRAETRMFCSFVYLTFVYLTFVYLTFSPV